MKEKTSLSQEWSKKYVVITPVFNEEQHIEPMIRSMIRQSPPPVRWILVDDNSTDGTYAVAAPYADEFAWITLVKKTDSDIVKKVGTKVIQAFNFGCQFIGDRDFAFIVKLDGDLVLPDDYFAQVAEAFQKHPEVGICGGYCVNRTLSGDIVEKSASYHIRGALKSVRKECWIEIGGFQEVLGWDGLDEMTAMYKGWKTMTLDCPVIHLRPTGKDYSNTEFAIQKGVAAYRNGSNVFLTLIRALVRVNQKPCLFYSLNYIAGYFRSLVKREEKNVSPGLARFINRYHLSRLLKFKRL